MHAARWSIAAWLLAGAGACGEADSASAPDAALTTILPVDAAPLPDADPNRYLSQTGLYVDIASQRFAPDLLEFEPRYKLWSDGAEKRRWVRLPAHERIDTSDMEHWLLPVGTQFFKEFRAPDGTLLETRLIEHVADTGDDALDYWMGAFLWRADASDAVFVPAGASDVNGTPHDVPTQTQCRTCHQGEPGHALGFSALQLYGDGVPGLRLADLVAAGRLSHDPPDGVAYVVPGDAATAAALGYVHANCGHCHNPHGAARPDVDMTLRLDLVAATPEETTIYRNTVGVPLFRFNLDGYTLRIAPGDPGASAVYFRMGVRDKGRQMPPLATEFPDETALQTLSAWISSL
jgi:hypothetical protein